MLRINKKGFALVETLIVSVFVMTMFTLMYTNFFPIMGEYERRQNYDDIDSLYKTFLVKRMVESVDFKAGNDIKNAITSSKYIMYNVEEETNANNTCKVLVNQDSVEYCTNLMVELGATRVVFSRYQLEDLKNYVKTENGINVLGNDFCDYIKTQPYFSNNSNNPKNFQYRVIVVYKKTINEESVIYRGKTIISYSTLGVVM